MADNGKDPKVDTTKNPKPDVAGTDINKSAVKVDKRTEPDEDNTVEDDFKDKMNYATKVHNAANDEDAIIAIKSDDDMALANAVIADGHATMGAEQVGNEVVNYLILTEDGKRAVQAYNTKTD